VATRETGSSTPAQGASEAPPSLGPGPDSELTWLLHRAAQRMRAVTGQAAEQHGLSMRDHIVLSALHLAPGMSQIELGRAVGMDKTTLTSELDRLERSGLVRRSVSARDRRARTLTITPEGDELRHTVSVAADHAEREALRAFSSDDVVRLRRMLVDLIGTTQDPGTCL
jgi:DNA-binding MarR family transcriptional regulator